MNPVSNKELDFHKTTNRSLSIDNNLFFIDFSHIVSRDTSKPEYTRNRLHKHDHYELHIILKKVAEYEYGNKRILLKPGDFVIFPPSFRHRIVREPKGFSKISLSFDFYSKPTKETNFYNLVENALKVPFTFMGNTFIKNLGERILKIHKDSYIDLDEVILFNFLSLLLEIFKLIVKATEIKITKTSSDSRMNDAVKYIEENISADLTVKEVADSVFLSTKQFSRLFEASFNISPGEYIKTYRIKYIKNLLVDLDYSISDIAEMLGYNNVASLTKMFKRAEDITPSEYRKSLVKK